MKPQRLFVLALIFLGATGVLSCWAQAPEQQDAQPLDDAGLQRLQRLKAQADGNHGNNAFLYDYMQALEAANRDAELFALLPRVDLESAPPTVLARLGRAANNQKHFSTAVEIFRMALARAPGRSDVIGGLAYALIDDEKAGDAVALLESQRATTWQEVPLLAAYAEALRAVSEHSQALTIYERILALDPGNRDAQRNRVFTVARLGAPHQALEMVQDSPGLLTDEELFELRVDRAAVAARWGAAADQDSPQRFAGTDAALVQNALLLERASSEDSGADTLRRRLQFDRIVLLGKRVRMQEAVELHQRLVDEGVESPAYAQRAAADAYLHLRQPEKARDLYLAARSQGEREFDAQIGLFYAYSDAEQHASAIAEIDQLVAETPQKANAYSRLTIGDNPDFASAVATAGAARASQDRFDEAQQQLEAFRDLAPWNMEGREKLATVYSGRGWPRRSEQERQWVLAAEPRNRAARTGYADSLRELRDWEPAQREATQLELEYPEDAQVQRVARLWRIHQMRELQVEAGTGTSSGSGGPLGSREYQIESYLYSAPIYRDWRAFAHHFEARAVFPNNRGFRRRIGAGAEYRIRDWRASAEISKSYDDESDIGLSIAGEWSASDQWTFDAGLDTSSNDIPVQARDSGVRGWSVQAGATYRVHESRSFQGRVQTIDFSDGNRRKILSGSASQRFVTGPVFKLDGVLGLFTSRNSLAAAPYFNPSRDFAVDVTLIGEQRLWRRYERSFVHRLYVSLGRYQQQGFGSGSTRAIRYEHDWSFDDRLNLLYGAQRTLHPYDGQREYANYYNVAVNWKF